MRDEGAINSRRRNENLNSVDNDRSLRLLVLVIVLVKGGDTSGCHDTGRCMDRIRDCASSSGSIVDMYVSTDIVGSAKVGRVRSVAVLVDTGLVAHLLVVLVGGTDGSGEEEERKDDGDLHGDGSVGGS